MGAVDGLLSIVDMKNANGLVLALGEVPALLLGSGSSPLTMPPLSSTLMEPLLSDLLTAEQRTQLHRDGTFETHYHSRKSGSFSVLARMQNGKLSLTLHRGTQGTPSPPTAPSPPESPSSPTPPVHSVPTMLPTVPSPVMSPKPRVTESRAIPHGLFEQALDQALHQRASDLLLSSHDGLWLRVDGRLQESSLSFVPTEEQLTGFFAAHWTETKRADFARSGGVDFALVHRGPQGPVRFRGNVFRHTRGCSAALRPIWSEVPSLDDLQLPSTLSQLIEVRHGLVLVTGPTGSGKSTTLASLLEQLNATRPVHIVTLEDPIEYAYTRKRALIHQREVGEHVESFPAGLRAALRENPDVLLVGEMRDATTIRLALAAAQTGHLVLSTLHAGSSTTAVERMMDGFSDAEKVIMRFELAACLRFIVAQQLVPGLHGGRVPAVEILSVNHAVAAQIREGRTHMLATQLELGTEAGMTTMARALAELVRAGRITRAAAFAACDDRAALEKFFEDRRAPR